MCPLGPWCWPFRLKSSSLSGTPGPHQGLTVSARWSAPPKWVPLTMKTIRTQHGIAADFCYPDSEKLSLICPECGINSVGISPPEITYGEQGFRGLVVAIRCECKNLHIFSVVFGQHKGMIFLRTDVKAKAGVENRPRRGHIGPNP